MGTHDEGRSRPDVDEWLETSMPRLYGLAHALTGERAAAEDLCQEALATVVRKWHRVSGAEHPTAYARALVVNTFLSHKRRRWTTEVVSHEMVIGPLADAQGDHADAVVTRQALLAAVRALPPRQRAAVALRFYEDLADDDIAALMHCSVSTVRSSIHHALKALRQDAGRSVSEASS